ncbi:MAG TPA: NlpC/P60 family protein, partial [Candidatus Goldiibacteriota bacterium]|nr:NlpC/P60 family protein [Candidatus Goldiibacteriota bacterium]
MKSCCGLKLMNFSIMFFIIFFVSVNALEQSDVKDNSNKTTRIDETDKVKKALIREKIINVAMSYLGTEYWPGGQDTEYGMDCSGFTQLVYKTVGINIPRTAYEQYLK